MKPEVSIHYACLVGDLDNVRANVAAGVDIHQDDDRALRTASGSGHVEVVKYLLSQGATPVSTGEAGALSQACRYSHHEIIDLLIAAGADVKEYNHKPMYLAAAFGDMWMLKRLIEAGASITHDCLRAASVNGCMDAVEFFLASQTFEDSCLSDSLHQACISEHATVAIRLIAAGANVHTNNEIALAYACYGGDVETARVLLGAGADATANRDWFQGIKRYNRRHTTVAGLMLAAGARPERIHWKRINDRALPLLAYPLRRGSDVALLSDKVKAAWVRIHLRPKHRLGRVLKKVRACLDRPPVTPLGTNHPTRDQLIEHLKTGGKRFAREYWTEGLPLFVPTLDLGPVPEEFLPAAM